MTVAIFISINEEKHSVFYQFFQLFYYHHPILTGSKVSKEQRPKAVALLTGHRPGKQREARQCCNVTLCTTPGGRGLVKDAIGFCI
jgi:hypothetical protein